jgi:hypothetical protein
MDEQATPENWLHGHEAMARFLETVMPVHVSANIVNIRRAGPLAWANGTTCFPRRFSCLAGEEIMTTAKLLGLTLLGSASLITATAFAEPVADGGRKFTTALSGANEVPPADPDGSGSAHVVVNVGQQRVCWDITVNNIAAPTRGHIHKAAAGANGPIVVGFFEPADPDLSGCTTAALDRALLKDIIQHPSSYYVNVHNAEFPGGAIRGQLHK